MILHISLIQIRSPLSGAVKCLTVAPCIYLRMITGEQDIWDLPSMPHLRAGILRILKQSVLKGIRLGTGSVPEYPRDQPGNGIDDNHRREFSACQHIIPD